MSMREAVVEYLSNLPADRGAFAKGSNFWMKCPNPEHPGESTASFKVSLDPPHTGRGYCFGCRWKGDWPAVAELLGLDDGAGWLAESYAHLGVSDDQAKAMLGETPAESAHVLPANYRYWPGGDWRSVPEALLRAVDARLFVESKRRALILPVTVWGESVGHVKCKIDPKEFGLSYVNSPGPWAHDALYPFDYVEALGKIDTLVLVEGARDALVTIRNGWPALALLGSTSWTPACRDLVLGLSPARVVLLFDPDDAGEKAARRVYADLADSLPVRVVWLPSKRVEDDYGRVKRKKLKDPADLNARQLDFVMQKSGVERVKYAWPHIQRRVCDAPPAAARDLPKRPGAARRAARRAR